MRHARVFGLVGLAAAATMAVAFAQTTIVPVEEEAPVQIVPLEVDLSKTTWGDAEAGAAKASVCAACHGADGNSMVDMYPSIAGQSELYIAHQMAIIASGQRTEGAVVAMVPFVQGLSPQDMRDIGAFFAAQKGHAGLSDDTVVAEGEYEGLKFYEIGQQLFRGGDAERGIPACQACHGPSGAGNPGPPYPRVAGQKTDYTAARLQYFRNGVSGEKDQTDFHVMAKVAKKLTDEEIMSLATYLESLHNRADDEVVAKAGGSR